MAHEKFRVQREHYGDKVYSTGDIRIADPVQVRHLVSKGILAPMPKAAPKPKNKAEPAVKNKAAE